MADNKLKLQSELPVVFRKFKCEVDSEEVDVEDLGTEYLAETTNMTAQRKIGSLSPFGGTSFAQINGDDLSTSNLPIVPSEFKLIDFYNFSMDRDNKEITILIFEKASTGEVKYFINPYFNPASEFNNHNSTNPFTLSTATQNAWNYGWLELTESYIGTQTGAISGDTFTLSSNLKDKFNYFKGWFAVNTSMSLAGYNDSRYQYIIEHNNTSQVYKCRTTPTGWADGNIIKFFRFPCIYFYTTKLPTPGNPHYQNTNGIFNAKPTDFHYAENQLRIACGKDRRPLILSMVYKKTYLVGAETTTLFSPSFVNYDGLWLDFQNPVQSLYDSQMSAFRTTSTGSGGTIAYIKAVDPLWVSVAPPNGVKIEFLGASAQLGLVFRDNVTLFSLGIVGTIGIISLPNGTPIINISDESAVTTAQLVTFLQSRLSSMFTVSLIGASATLSGSFVQSEVIQLFTGPGTASYGQDGGNNGESINLFLGVKVSCKDTASCTTITGNKKRAPFIMSLLLDNRNEVIVGNGNLFVNPKFTTNTADHDWAITSSDSLQIKFNSWFSRRISTVNLYVGDSEEIVGTFDATCLGFTVYPYFAWLKKVSINTLPLFASYDIGIFNKQKNSEMAYSIEKIIDPSKGVNSYTLNKVSSYWFVAFNDSYNKLGTIGTGLSWIANTGRFLDSDITMNYTRITKMGQTNGRFFIIGCKNTVEVEEFETDDYIIYNVLSAGVSSYDVFTREKIVNAGIGDKDIIRAIQFYEGYLVVIKDTNVYFIDISTADELQFRVVKTTVGRGCTEPDSICYTPYGIVLPSKDSVYLLNPRGGSKQLLNSFNGRLNWYREYFSDKKVCSIYYNSFNELFLMQVSTSPTVDNYIMVYNFDSDTWTTIHHNTSTRSGNTAYVKVRTNQAKEVLFANVYDFQTYNIVKFDENVLTYRNSAGDAETLVWKMKTHSMPLGDKLKDILINAFELRFDYECSGNKILKSTIYKNNTPIESFALSLNSLIPLGLNKKFTQLTKQTRADDQVEFSISNINLSGTPQPYLNFNLNSFVLWITTQNRQLKQS